MNPRRKQALIFFFATILLSMGILAWQFRLNRGNLVLQGDAPFTVTIGKFKNYLCVESPCGFRLTPKKYRMSAVKDGYFDISAAIEIKRWRDNEAKLDFVFKPKIETLGEASLPEKLAGIPAFFGSSFINYSELDLEKIPRGVSSALFSFTGKYALVSLGREYYLFHQPAGAGDSDGASEAQLLRIRAMPDASSFDERNDALYFLESVLDDKGGSQRISKLSLKPLEKIAEPGAVTVISAFERPIARPKLFISPNAENLLIQEKISNGESRLYLVNLEKKTKTRIALPASVQNARWVSKDTFLYDMRQDGRIIVFLYSIGEKEPKVFPAMTAYAAAPWKDNRVIFVSLEDVLGSETGISISEVLEMVKEGKEFTTSKNIWYFLEFNLETGKFSSIAKKTHEVNEEFLEAAEQIQDGKLFFSAKKDGKKINHELILEK